MDNAVSSSGIKSVIRVKDRRLKVVKDTNTAFRNRDSDIIWRKNETTVSVCDTVVQMNGATVPVRYVKFFKKTKDRKTGKSKYSQICVITTAMHVSLETLYKIIQARWGVENNVFRQLKTEWHMDHCFIHDENGFEASLIFMIIAFNLMQLFFFRRMKNFRQRRLLQVEIIERIIREMVVYNAGDNYLIDTG